MAVVGGLLVSQLLTLYITPVIYIWLDNLGRRAREWRTARRRGEARGVTAQNFNTKSHAEFAGA